MLPRAMVIQTAPKTQVSVHNTAAAIICVDVLGCCYQRPERIGCTELARPSLAVTLQENWPCLFQVQHSGEQILHLS